MLGKNYYTMDLQDVCMSHLKADLFNRNQKFPLFDIQGHHDCEQLKDVYSGMEDQ